MRRLDGGAGCGARGRGVNAPPKLPGGAGFRPGTLRSPARSSLTADRRGPLEVWKARLTQKAPQTPGQRRNKTRNRKRGPGAEGERPQISPDALSGWRAERRPHVAGNGGVPC